MLSLPPAFVLSQDQTLKLNIATAMILDSKTLHIVPTHRWAPSLLNHQPNHQTPAQTPDPPPSQADNPNPKPDPNAQPAAKQ